MRAAPAGSLLLVSGALLLGCGPSEQVHFVPMPEAPGASSYVVRIGSELRAGNIDEAIRAPLEENLLVELAFYSRALEALGLSSGPLEGQRACLLSCETLETLAVLTGTVRDTELEWRSLDEMSEGMKDALVPDRLHRCSACPAIERVLLPLPVPRNVKVKFTAACDRGVYLGLSGGELLYVRDDETVHQLCAGGASPSLGLIQHGVCRDGEVWLIGGEQIARLDVAALNPALPCLVSTSTGPGGFDRADGGERESFVRAAISGPNEPFEIFITTNQGRVVRYDDSGWSEHGRLSAAPSELFRIAWLGPRRALASAGVSELALIGPEGLTIRALPEAFLRMRAFARLSDGSVLFGTDARGLYRLHDSIRWEVVGVQGWLDNFGMTAHRNGAFYTAEGGAFGYYDMDRGPCPIELVGFSTERVYELAPLDAARVILGDIVTSEPLRDSAVGLVRAVPSSCLAR